MRWFIGMIVLIAGGGNLVIDSWSHYLRVESYEIHPGILMTARESPQGSACEILVEAQHLQGAAMYLRPSIPHESTLEIIDQLAPRADRGKVMLQLGGHDFISEIQGNMDIDTADYENVSIRILSARDKTLRDDEALLIRWKKRTCAEVRGDKND